MRKHYKDCNRSKTLASTDKPVNANKHSAALCSPLFATTTCYLLLGARHFSQRSTVPPSVLLWPHALP
jgi:hypothetical protein